jgi:hypothetical protein
LHVERFMRAFDAKCLAEAVKLIRLGTAGFRWRARGFSVERPLPPLMTTVVLRLTRFDALWEDA